MAAPETLSTSAPAETAPRRRGRPRKAAGEGSARRDALIAVAAQHFRSKGFDATTMRDIAAASGMQSGSPFYHFKSKNDLLCAVMEQGMERALDGQRQALVRLPEGADAAVRLQALVLHHLRVLLAPGHDFVAVMLYEQRALARPERLRITALKDRYEVAWKRELELLQAQARLRAPASTLRLMLFGAVHGALSWYDRKQALSLAQLAAQITQVFVLDAPTP